MAEPRCTIEREDLEINPLVHALSMNLNGIPLTATDAIESSWERISERTVLLCITAMILRFDSSPVFPIGARARIRPQLKCGIAFCFVLVLLLNEFVHAQIGSTICICSPSMYTMQLNFSSNCENSSLVGDGILTSDCAIDPFQNPNATVIDEVPVTVSSIDILELDVDLVKISQSSRFGTFNNGDIIQFASVSSDPSALNETFYPKALQVSMIGINDVGETLFFAGLIIYSTECNQFPLIQEGSTIGWVTLVSRDNSTMQPANVYITFSFCIFLLLLFLILLGRIRGSIEFNLSSRAINECIISAYTNFTDCSSIPDRSIPNNSKCSISNTTAFAFNSCTNESVYKVPITYSINQGTCSNSFVPCSLQSDNES